VAARSLWNGTIAFGEVSVAIKLFSAVKDHSVHFHEVRLSDGCRIVHRRVGSESGREIPAERIGNAYESSRGHQVVLEDEVVFPRFGGVVDLTRFSRSRCSGIRRRSVVVGGGSRIRLV
jgi:DNA end-binding protein Ku